jgi:hypothetical protein
MGLAMSLNLDIDSLPPEQVEAAITRLEMMKAQRAAENKLAGGGCGRSSAISRKISWNICRAMATSP